MNAGGVDKACKSNELFFEFNAITSSWRILIVSGERVSNTLVRTPESGITSRKVG